MKKYEAKNVLAYMREAKEIIDRLADELKALIQDYRCDCRLGVDGDQLAKQEAIIWEKKRVFDEISDEVNRRSDEMISALGENGPKFPRESPRSDQRDPNHSGDPENAL